MGSLFGSGGGAYKQQKKAAATQEAEGEKLYKQAEAGQLPPGIQSWLDQYLTQANARVAGTYGNLGIQGSTAQAIDEASVAGNVAKQKEGFLQEQINTALSLMGLSGQNYTGAAQGMAAENQATASAFAGFGQALGGTDFSSFA